MIKDQFLNALACTPDAEANKALKLLHAKHTRAAKDLQKRLKYLIPWNY